jgi:hypothetical protein
MQSITGSLSAAGVSSAIYVPAGESFTAVLTVAAMEAFQGLIAVERSRDGINFTPALDHNDAEVQFDGTETPLEGAVFSGAIVNTDSKRNMYRVRATSVDGGSDAISYSMAEVVGDRLGVILTDVNGRPVAWMRDDGAVEFIGIYAAAYQGGGGPGLPMLNPFSFEYVTTPGAASVELYETKLTTGGSAAGEALTVADGIYIGQRKLLTVVGMGDPGDSVDVAFTNIGGRSGELLAALSIDAALNGYLLLEWRGDEDGTGGKWWVIAAGENTTVTPD